MSAPIVVVETIVRSLADTAVANEAYFCDLDSVVGDGDFGYSLARGFEKVLEGFDGFDRETPSGFLKQVALVITSRCGGTSGPIWGTGFLRAAAVINGRTDVTLADAVPMLRAAQEGIMKRGGAALGDKTLLDALAPFTARLEEQLAAGAEIHAALAAAVDAAGAGATETINMVAKRGRASYTGDRSIGSPDAGATALALMLKNVSLALQPMLAT